MKLFKRTRKGVLVVGVVFYELSAPTVWMENMLTFFHVYMVDCNAQSVHFYAHFLLEGRTFLRIEVFLYVYENINFLTIAHLGPFFLIFLIFFILKLIESSKIDIPKILNSKVGRVAY